MNHDHSLLSRRKGCWNLENMYLPKPGIELTLKKGGLTSGGINLFPSGSSSVFSWQAILATESSSHKAGTGRSRSEGEWGIGADSQEVFVSLDGQFGLMAKCLARVRCGEGTGRRHCRRNWGVVQRQRHQGTWSSSHAGNVISVISYYASLFLMFFVLVWRHWFGLIKSLWFAIFVWFILILVSLRFYLLCLIWLKCVLVGSLEFPWISYLKRLFELCLATGTSCWLHNRQVTKVKSMCVSPKTCRHHGGALRKQK